MDRDLKALIESPEFGRYHQELHSPAFNPFDVLQVADLEIRHSNVLAWLLRPGETHGIGGRFLRAVVEHLARRHDVSSLRSLTGFDDQDNVEITREDYHERLYADITVGFKKERVLLVIENKLGASSPDAEEQVEAYQKAFGEKYTRRYDRIPGVLLTTSTSPEGNDAERGFIHLGWEDIGRIIRSLLDEAENFADCHVRAFVERYVDVIEEKLIHVGDDLAERLRDEHPRILTTLREDRTQLDEVDEPHRATIKRWMEYFEGRPRRLREKVAEYLEVKHRSGAGVRKTGRTDGPGGGWLHWWDPRSKVRWEIRVEPTSSGGITIVLPGDRPCDAAGAVCTAGGKRLSNSPPANGAAPVHGTELRDMGESAHSRRRFVERRSVTRSGSVGDTETPPPLWRPPSGERPKQGRVAERRRRGARYVALV